MTRRRHALLVFLLASVLLAWSLPATAFEPSASALETAAQGGAEAQYKLGEAYFVAGDDYPAAKKWLQKAAEQGHGLAQLRLAFLCAEAHFPGLKTDYEAAEAWFRKAAEQDAGDARFRLGNFYANYKTPRDHAGAFKWLKLAAEGGHRTAMFDVARMYRDGKGTERDDALALHWMTRAAEEGVLQASLTLSEMYANGNGAPKDPALSVKWLLKVTESPGAPAFSLSRAGDIFMEGWGTVSRNLPLARKFYIRAAAKGDPHARRKLEELGTAEPANPR